MSGCRIAVACLLAILAGSVRQVSTAAPPVVPQHVPWLTEIQTPPDTLPAETPRLRPVLRTRDGQEIATLPAWEKRRAEIRQAWLDFLGPLRSERKPPRLEVVKEDRPEGVIRQLVRYEGESGQTVEGYLLKPAEANGRRAGIVALHSTANETIRQPAGVAGDPRQAFALNLARRGYVVFCPECFLWQGAGDYAQRVARFHQRHPGAKGMAKMVFDAQRGLDVLESLPDVDGKRLGAVGHSLGGKEVLYLAALDERVKAAVSSEGGIDISYSNWDAVWYLSDAVQAKDFSLTHHELLALVAPRPFLLIGGDSADGAKSWPHIAAVLPVYKLYGEPAPLGLFNHRRGHVVPPEAHEKIEAWFAAYLGPAR